MVKRGAFLLFKGSKKGLSPLIATVLLIAFAVAMGAMIMNWGSSFGENEDPDCSGIHIIASPVICYEKSMNLIKLGLKNEGDAIEELKVNIVSDDAENVISLRNSKMRKKADLSKDIPFTKAGSTYVGITPLVLRDGKIVPCPQPALEIYDLQDCTT
jgi:flagellin-like protein